MDVASSGPVSPEARAAAWARVGSAVAALNAGNPDVLLDGYVDDVVVVAPLGDVEDPATDFVLRGRAAYRHYLLTFLGFHGGFELTDLAVEPDRLIVSVLTRTGERKRLTVTLGADGRGTRVVVLAVP